MTASPSPTFCILPWVHVHVIADGSAYPCCLADMRHPLTNLHDQPDGIEGVIHHPALNEMRRRMLCGERCSQCVKCYAIEDAGGRSMRQDSNDRYRSQISAAQSLTASETGVTTGFEMRYLDVRFSNICNLACLSCSPSFSSSLYDLHEKMGAHIPPTKFLDLKAFDALVPYLNTVTNVNFAGGEPLIMEDHYKVMQHWSGTGRAADVSVNYTSNLTRLTYKGMDAVALWASFPRVTIQASIDAWGEENARIRRGSNWKQIVANYRRVRTEAPHVKIKISPTVSALNMMGLFDMVKRFAEELGHDTAAWAINPLQHPEHLAVAQLDDATKAEIRRRYDAFRHWAQAGKHWIDWPSFDVLIAMMDCPMVPRLVEKREAFLRDFDAAAAKLGRS